MLVHEQSDQKKSLEKRSSKPYNMVWVVKEHLQAGGKDTM